MRRNIAANLAGRIITSGLRAVLLPLYLHVLGIETYGLVGVYVTLRNLLAILDFGIGASFIRDVAQMSSRPDADLARRELLQTLELLYWAVAVAAGGVVVGIAPFLAQHWLHAQHLSAQDVERAIRLMGVATCFSFPLAFYQGGLFGLQRQTLANGLSVGLGALQDVGAFLMITAIPTIQAFLSWHVCSSLLTVTVTALVLHRLIPAVVGARRFSKEAFAASFRFGAGWFGHSAGSIVVTQADKVLVTRFVPLEQFGYYTIAQSLAMFLMTLISPIQTAAFPRLAQIAAAGDAAGVEREYERATQYMILLLVPAASVLIAFAPSILLVWTRRSDVALHSATLLRIFAVGACCTGLSMMLTTVQGAYGWLRAIVTTSLVSASVAFPLTYLGVKMMGIQGAAVVWTIQSGALLFTAPLAHRKLRLGRLMRWLLVSVMVPAALAAIIAFVGRSLIPELDPRTLRFIILVGLVWVCCSVCTGVVLPYARNDARDLVLRLRAATVSNRS